MTSAAMESNERATSRMAIGVLLTAGAVFLCMALISYEPAQITGTGAVSPNWCGTAGAWVAAKMIEAWGVAAYYPALVILGYAVLLLRGGTLSMLPMRLTGAVLLLPALCGLLHLLPASSFERTVLQRWDQVQYHGLGGTLGFLLAGPAGVAEMASVVDGMETAHPGGILRRHLDAGGTALILMGLTVACLFLMRINLLAIGARVVRAVRKHRGTSMTRNERKATMVPDRTEAEEHKVTPTPGVQVSVQERSKPITRTMSSVDEVARKIKERDSTTSLDAKDLVERIRARRRALEESGQFEVRDNVLVETKGGSESSSSRNAAVASPEAPATSDTAPSVPAQTERSAAPPSTPRDNSPTPAVKPAAKPAAKSASKPRPLIQSHGANGEYELPPVDILGAAPERRDSEHDAEIASTTELIETVFAEFNINVKVVNSNRGPVITQYELELLDTGMRVNRVVGFEKDLSLRLGTEGIRIVAPLPNRKTIGIEVPNTIKEAVVMKDLVEEIDPNTFTLPLIIGRDVLGAPMVGDLARMPHLLIAGATGMGKSVCLNAIITSVLLFRGPDEVKFIMVDPKMVELAGYEGIPHLMTPPITDMSKAHAALEWCCKVMDERFFALRMVGVRDIISYNKLGREEIEQRLKRKGKSMEDLSIDAIMPWIIVVVDEFADLMMVNKEVEKSIIRLCAKSRACGIHVILATQRPSADVVTGLIKSNLPTRICFRVADKNNSRVVLDAGGAENMLGRGDMLYMPPGSSSLVRGQGVWVKDEEIDGIIEHARSQGEPEYDESIFQVGAAALAAEGNGGTGGDAGNWLADRQFHEAVWTMYRSNKTGADFLRRRLNVGYNKATKYVEWMEDLGFLSPAKGSKPRDFLRSWDDWIDELKIAGMSWEEDDEIYINPLNL
ncbi:MAG: DNA translocase FtsK 4TM domain-containing protein [Planctomycetota bacterium]|jgi:S-DNA-T family DNA segregation ATPase FtsK/SpoIIIE|nr:DNA translocase FtsK 4TM domain-containing protein [Planctomycetota bacterium]